MGSRGASDGLGGPPQPPQRPRMISSSNRRRGGASRASERYSRARTMATSGPGPSNQGPGGPLAASGPWLGKPGRLGWGCKCNGGGGLRKPPVNGCRSGQPKPKQRGATRPSSVDRVWPPPPGRRGSLVGGPGNRKDPSPGPGDCKPAQRGLRRRRSISFFTRKPKRSRLNHVFCFFLPLHTHCSAYATTSPRLLPACLSNPALSYGLCCLGPALQHLSEIGRSKHA